MKRSLSVAVALVFVVAVAPSLARADFGRCVPNEQWAITTQIQPGATLVSNEFSLMEHDRIFARGRGAKTNSYAIKYQLQQKSGTSWIDRGAANGGAHSDGQV